MARVSEIDAAANGVYTPYIGTVDQSVAARISRFVDDFKVAWKTRRTVAALSALSDHQLKDIGLCRNDIHQVAVKTSILNVL